MLHFDQLQVRDYSFEKQFELVEIQMRGRWIHNWFSNFLRIGAPVTYRDHTTDCLELAFVAAKNPDILVDFTTTDGTVYEQVRFIDLIFKLNDPGKAKRLGSSKARHGLIDPRPDWDYVKLAAMDNLLRQRWRPGLSETSKLVSMVKQDRIDFISDDNPIIELNNWGDRTWGVTADAYFGRNGFGRLLHYMATEFLITGDIAYGAPEEYWIHRQIQLIHLLNNTADGGRSDVFDREH